MTKGKIPADFYTPPSFEECPECNGYVDILAGHPGTCPIYHGPGRIPIYQAWLY